MRLVVPGLLVTAMLVAQHPSIASARESVAVTVRIYNQFGESLRQLKASQSIAAVLFRNAGFDVQWRLCRSRTGPSADLPDRCDDRLRPDEVAVRVTGGDLNDDASVLGYAYIDARDGVGGVLATVLTDRVHAQADRDGVQREHLLALTIAHELGHLLMGTGAHSRQGLMKERWSASDVQRGPLARWAFSADEKRALRVGVSARLKFVSPPAFLSTWTASEESPRSTAEIRLVR